MIDQQKPRVPSMDYRVISGAAQFYWIAALSVVNSVLYATDSNIMFPVGLAPAALVSALAGEWTLTVRIAAGFAVLLLLGLFAVCGYFARKGEKWAFVLGGSIYLLDAFLWLFLGDWLASGIHAFFLYYIVRGFIALRQAAKPA